MGGVGIDLFGQVAIVTGAAVGADVSDRTSVDDAVRRVRAELGPVRIVVNNAATCAIKPFKDTTNAVLFFASPVSDWITGQILSVSGGYTMV